MSTEPTQAEWKQMQKIALIRMHDKYDPPKMSEKQRNMKAVVLQDRDTMETILISPIEALQEVEALSDIGKYVIRSVMQQLKQLQP